MAKVKTVKLDDLTPLEAAQTPKPRTKKLTTPKVTKPVGSVLPWAYSGVGLTLGLSAWLNGLAFSTHSVNPVNGWVLGIAIPVLVLLFSRVSAILYSTRQRQLSYAGAVATISILLLSVQHCAQSISALTGEHVILAGMLALSVDLGLVVSEIATVKRK